MPRDLEKRRKWDRDRYKTKLAPIRKILYEQDKAAGICPNCRIRPAMIGVTFLCEKCNETRKRVTVNYYSRVRKEVFDRYGGMKCNCCGETEPKFLSIDHIAGGGNKHRREIKTSRNRSTDGHLFYVWLKTNGYPPGFQVLCMNCNMGRHRNKGICPHQAAKEVRHDPEVRPVS